MEEGMISLQEWLWAKMQKRDAAVLRELILGEIERAENVVQTIRQEMRYPSDLARVALEVGQKAAEAARVWFGVLEEISDGVPLDQITLPQWMLESLPTIITEEIGRPDWADEVEEGTPLEVLGLSPRVAGALRRSSLAHYDKNGWKTLTVEDLLAAYRERGEQGLLMLRGIGEKALEEILNALRAKGFCRLRSRS